MFNEDLECYLKLVLNANFEVTYLRINIPILCEVKGQNWRAYFSLKIGAQGEEFKVLAAN